MLPYFHASGHFLYAKSCQLYLQDMMNLKSKMPQCENEQFVNQGFFTIRRSDKFWSGLWTDMTIEQVVMRSLKARGGLTAGRGITDSTLLKWVASAPIIMEVSLQIEEFSGATFATTDQHVDARLTRVTRDENWIEMLHSMPHLQGAILRERANARGGAHHNG